MRPEKPLASLSIPVDQIGSQISRSIIIGIPINLFSHEPPPGDKRRILKFTTNEILVEHGIVHRIEFREKRCNLTLKNLTSRRQSVNVRVWVLNKSLIQLWHQSEKWSLSTLQPNQIHVFSWDFIPAVPDVIWNVKARGQAPAWIIIDAL